MEPMTFSVPPQTLYMGIIALLMIAVAVPSPVQPIAKAILAFFKKPEPAPPLPDPNGKPPMPLDVKSSMSDIVQQLLTLLLKSGPNGQAIIADDLIRVFKTLVDNSGGKVPDLLQDLLGLFTREHAMREDVDLSPELKAAWAKVAAMSLTAEQPPLWTPDPPKAFRQAANVVAVPTN